MPNAIPKDLLSIIKQISVNAIMEGKPVDIQYGTVESAEPLVIRTNQKLLLEAEDLVLSNMVQDHTVDMTVSHQTEEIELIENRSTDYKKHRHEYKGRKKITLHYGLKAGEKVLLLREQGGQKFFIVDRVSEVSAEGEWL